MRIFLITSFANPRREWMISTLRGADHQVYDQLRPAPGFEREGGDKSWSEDCTALTLADAVVVFTPLDPEHEYLLGFIYGQQKTVVIWDPEVRLTETQEILCGTYEYRSDTLNDLVETLAEIGADLPYAYTVPEGARTCRVCGCWDGHECPGGCSWVEGDLCSTCAGPLMVHVRHVHVSVNGAIHHMTFSAKTHEEALAMRDAFSNADDADRRVQNSDTGSGVKIAALPLLNYLSSIKPHEVLTPDHDGVSVTRRVLYVRPEVLDELCYELDYPPEDLGFVGDPGDGLPCGFWLDMFPNHEKGVLRIYDRSELVRGRNVNDIGLPTDWVMKTRRDDFHRRVERLDGSRWGDGVPA